MELSKKIRIYFQYDEKEDECDLCLPTYINNKGDEHQCRINTLEESVEVEESIREGAHEEDLGSPPKYLNLKLLSMTENL